MSVARIERGSFQAGEFAPLLRSCVHSGISGRLEVAGEEGVRSLWLESGRVRAVTSRLEEEKLGRWLVARERLDSNRMALTLLRQREGVRFGSLLVDEGLLEPEDLARELEELAVSIVSRLLLTAGDFALLPEDFPLDAATLQMSTASLLVRAVRVLPVEQIRSGLVDPKQFLVALEDRLGWGEGATLSPHEAFLYSRVDGCTTVVQLRRLTPMGDDDCVRAAAALITAGLAELRTEPVRGGEALDRSATPDSGGDDPMEFSPEQQAEYEEISRLATELPHQDYYRRLALTPTASREEIQAGYRELTSRYRVERAQEPHLRVLRRELEAIQVALQDAFNTVGYAERRARYDAHLRQGEVSGAEVAVVDRQRTAARSEVVEANTRRAAELIRSGDYGMAVELLDQAVRFDPRPDTLLMLARLELRNPMWSQRGLSHLRMAVSLQPDCVEAWLELAKFWARRQQPSKQAQCLERVLEREPDHPEALRLLKGLPASVRGTLGRHG